MATVTAAPRLAVRPKPLSTDDAIPLVALLADLVRRAVADHATMPPAARHLLVYAAERCLTLRSVRAVFRAIERETGVSPLLAQTLDSMHARAGLPKLAVILRQFRLAVVGAMFAAHPRSNVADIAFATGYSSAQAFTRLLRKHRGSPSVYRTDASLYSEWAGFVKPMLAHPGWGRVRYLTVED